MNRYAYKLEGYDKDWNHVGERSTAYYTNLRPAPIFFMSRLVITMGYGMRKGRL